MDKDEKNKFWDRLERNSRGITKHDADLADLRQRLRILEQVVFPEDEPTSTRTRDAFISLTNQHIKLRSEVRALTATIEKQNRVPEAPGLTIDECLDMRHDEPKENNK